MTYVYILSDYQESGAENVVATLDRSILPLLLNQNWPVDAVWSGDAAWRACAHTKLQALLKRSDEELAFPVGHGLHDGWGGVQLHVVRLAESSQGQMQGSPP